VWGRVLEVGSRNLNGSVREVVAAGEYHGIDLRAGPGVDEVADAATYTAPEPFDLVVCCEVLEHVPEWDLIVRAVARNLRPGGRAVITCAGPGRPEHSGIEATDLKPGEFYANPKPSVLASCLEQHFSAWTLDRAETPSDLRVVATK
jgi:SAM-dependent methyltransferase